MRILFFLLLVISINSFGQNPANYQYRVVYERLRGLMPDSVLHLPRYNGTPVGLRGGSSTQDGAIATDTTNGRLYMYWDGSWVRMARFSEINTYTANPPIRVTGTVISADTSVAFTPSLTTNARLLKVADSIRLAAISGGAQNLQSVTDIGSVTTNAITAPAISYSTSKFVLSAPGGNFGRLSLSNVGDFAHNIEPQAASNGSTIRLPNTGNTTDTLATLHDVRAGGGGGGGTDLSALDTLPNPKWRVVQNAAGSSYKSNAPKVYYAEDFPGVIPDDGLDDWAGIDSALKYVNAAGGGDLILPLGKLHVSRTIKFPLNAFDSTDDLRSIRLMGQMIPNMVSEPLSTRPHPNFGTIIEGTFLGDSAVIATHSSVGTWGNFNFMNITIENLAIRVRSLTTGTDVAAEGIGIDAYRMAMVQIRNVSVSVTSEIGEQVQPASTSIGILWPLNNNFVMVNGDNIFITGFYTGTMTYEHASIDNLFLDACYYALRPNVGNHSTHFNKVTVARSRTAVKAEGGARFKIDNLSIESSGESGTWWETVLDLDAHPTAIGRIYYQRVETALGGENNDVFQRTDGPYNILCLPLGENLPTWATDNRPDLIPEAATVLGFNTDSSYVEVYDHGTTSWIPASPGGSGSGSSAWDDITDPAGSQALSFGDNELTAHTNGSNTETFWTTTSNSLTTGTVYSFLTNSMTNGTLLNLTSTSTALSDGNEALNISVSGANSNNVITATGARISVTNTNVSGSTNVGLDVTASGASTDNIALQATGRLAVTTASTVTALTATSSGQFNNAIILNNTDSRQMNIQWRRNNTVAWQIGHDFAGNTTNDFYWYDAVNAKNKLYFVSSTGAVHMGANAYSDPAVTVSDNKKVQFFGRAQNQQGADVASVAGAIALGLDGNSFELTGTNAVTLISNLNWQNGSTVTLLFTSTASLTDGTANSGTDIGMELAGNTNFTGSAGATITLILSEIGGTQRWREVSRSVN